MRGATRTDGWCTGRARGNTTRQTTPEIEDLKFFYDPVDDHDDHDDQKDTMIILTYRCPRPLPAIAAVRRLLLIFRAAGHGQKSLHLVGCTILRDVLKI